MNILWIYFSLLIFRGAVSLTCYSCSEGVSNDKCNVADTVCSSSQVCYTVISRRPIVVKRYTKGCMDRSDCYVKENLNDKLTCDEEGSLCTYCCDSRDYCNAYNSSYLISSSSLFCTVFVVMSYMLKMI